MKVDSQKLADHLDYLHCDNYLKQTEADDE